MPKQALLCYLRGTCQGHLLSRSICSNDSFDAVRHPVPFLPCSSQHAALGMICGLCQQRKEAKPETAVIQRSGCQTRPGSRLYKVSPEKPNTFIYRVLVILPWVQCSKKYCIVYRAAHTTAQHTVVFTDWWSSRVKRPLCRSGRWKLSWKRSRQRVPGWRGSCSRASGSCSRRPVRCSARAVSGSAAPTLTADPA